MVLALPAQHNLQSFNMIKQQESMIKNGIQINICPKPTLKVQKLT